MAIHTNIMVQIDNKHYFYFIAEMRFYVSGQLSKKGLLLPLNGSLHSSSVFPENQVLTFSQIITFTSKKPPLMAIYRSIIHSFRHFTSSLTIQKLAITPKSVHEKFKMINEAFSIRWIMFKSAEINWKHLS